ncbi:RdgB/HAM1 family non-canonical purine NTP pyrophosphatase [Varibaculum prostatecancerukia]|uniref:RdgB/HAM1 family non-canonical purine NTP pyrophosphatase n=1 Tax=Varibaculum prostatecancerukia TaxID=2811781 RepID=UPI001BFFFE87|nr:RdgB/HAM1 family non-canonical purine NTP pyrophosphatase [Varibaculum prostatecancerukia]
MKIPSGARLILATHNPHKVQELADILSPLIAGFSPEMIVGAGGLGIEEPVEDGVSFTENALIKARLVAQRTGLPTVADDSGLCVDIMGGAPGIFSARWCGHHGDDRANLQLLLDQLRDVPEENRGASFVCAAVLVSPAGLERHCLGKMSGKLLDAPRGDGGFGYDPIFLAEGQERTNAELSPEEKNALSHRGKAFRALAPAIAATIELGGNVTPDQARP